jgi:GrpB-like predicted nucleotidyltransferase (UPF0157 family)
MIGEQRYAQVPYKSEWPELFEFERDRLRAVFGKAALQIEHIGSTAVEGLAGRDVIDIAVMVASHDEAAGFKSTLLNHGYDSDPRNWTYVSERDFYTRGDPRDYHLSVAYTDRGGFWPRQIMFRDYLRAHRDERDAYAELKANIVAKSPSGEGYATDKTEFVYDVLIRAGWRYGQMYVAPGNATSSSVAPTSVEGRTDLSLLVSFEDGTEGSFDMSNVLGGDAFPGVANPEDFSRVRIDHDAIRWEAGPAVDPAYLYRRFTQA